MSSPLVRSFTWLVVFLSLGAAPSKPEWQAIGKGLEYRTFTLDAKPTVGDGILHVVRIDPAQATLAFGLASRDGRARTAMQWSAAKKFSVTINAGMFHTDQHSVGHLVDGAHVDRAKWNGYQSVLVFGAKKAGLPRAQLLDRDTASFDATQSAYSASVQNLRLIGHDGVNLWKPNGRKWSEAMVARDAKGRLLFLFTRTPYEMADLNARVLKLPLDVKAAMHAEGGPEASLSIHTDALSLDLAGSYETGFTENDDNAEQWDLPNVLGVLAE